MNTFTTSTSQSRPAARLRLMALIAGVCALAIPASVSASYGSAPESGTGSGSDGIARNSGLVAPDHTALNESLAPATGSNDAPGIDTPPAAPVESAPSSDSFDWADAALGAGVVMAAVTLGGLALVTLRRRTAVSPSA